MSDFNYNYRKNPPITVPCNVVTKRCRRCSAEFQTKSRTKQRCDACQHQVMVERGRIHDEGRTR